MPKTIEINFARSARPSDGLAVLLAADGGKLGAAAESVDPAKVLQKVFRISAFKGKARSAVDVIAPQGSAADRIAVLGIGDPASPQPDPWARLGGAICGQFGRASKVTVWLDAPGAAIGGREAA